MTLRAKALEELARKWCLSCQDGGTVGHSCLSIGGALREAVERCVEIADAAEAVDVSRAIRREFLE